MNVLFTGGTRFIGRTIVEELLRRGHTVTVYNRGRHEVEFPDPRDVGPGPLPEPRRLRLRCRGGGHEDSRERG